MRLHSRVEQKRQNDFILLRVMKEANKRMKNQKRMGVKLIRERVPRKAPLKK